jgi:hypothetical protein
MIDIDATLGDHSPVTDWRPPDPPFPTELHDVTGVMFTSNSRIKDTNQVPASARRSAATTCSGVVPARHKGPSQTTTSTSYNQRRKRCISSPCK